MIEMSDIFDEINEDTFWVYECVRRSGLTNMYDSARIRVLCSAYCDEDLNKEMILKIMRNYDELKRVYGINEPRWFQTSLNEMKEGEE